MDTYKNKYRISSARLPDWDYGAAALYFITICTKDRIHYFGEIDMATVRLSSIGDIVQSEWLKTFDLRQDMNLWMGEYVVMPNHFHAIIGIGENRYNTERDAHHRRDAMHGKGRDAMHRRGRDAMHRVSTTDTTKPFATTGSKNQFGPQSKNLASIVRGFKSAVTVAARLINPGFQWQSRFHDHIIRND